MRKVSFIEGVEVIAVADIRTDMAKEKVSDEGISIYSSLDELLANEEVDMVDICTPSYMHAELSIKAMEAGVHVLCEKLFYYFILLNIKEKLRSVDIFSADV